MSVASTVRNYLTANYTIDPEQILSIDDDSTQGEVGVSLEIVGDTWITLTLTFAYGGEPSEVYHDLDRILGGLEHFGIKRK